MPKSNATKSTPKADRSRFFSGPMTPAQPLTDADQLRHWSRKITVWVEHSNDRLKKLDHLPPVDLDRERDNVLCNRHVRVLFRPNKDEKTALIHLGSRYPGVVQTVMGALQYADHWYERLSEGPAAGEGLNHAIWELRDAIDAAVKGIEGGKGSGQREADNGRTPLTKRARIIWKHLQTLGDGEAMQLPEIQDWYESKADLPADAPKTLDEGVWKRVRNELLPYGLQNARGRGYYVKK